MAASENNEQQQLSEGFANICYKVVSSICLQELINNFAVCKHCSGALLLVEDSHGFRATLFNRSTCKMPHFYVALHKVYIFLTMLLTSLVCKE